MIDFTSCTIDPNANYGGSDQKRGIFYRGERYMLKMPDRIQDAKRNSLNSSYSNSVFSEHTSCQVLRALGFDAQETLLGFIILKDGTKKPVVACKNFVPNGYSLVDFRAIEDAFLEDHKAGKIPRIDDIYQVVDDSSGSFANGFHEVALQRYWDVFILDAMLGNFDRHANNWAYLVSTVTDEFAAGEVSIRLAPIYDCGSCLYPQISDEVIPDILASEDEILMRIDKFPTAALELSDGRKANYREFINSLKNKDCTAALLRVFPRLDVTVIKQTVDSINDLSDIRKEFYKVMIERRIERILKPAYERARNGRADMGELSVFWE